MSVIKINIDEELDEEELDRLFQKVPKVKPKKYNPLRDEEDLLEDRNRDWRF